MITKKQQLVLIEYLRNDTKLNGAEIMKLERELKNKGVLRRVV